mmetsp:Transcript_6479/g.8780  ORF Transcript_6479/g.8780 Transcript_6479/m.8780 type:complete len:443 (+) Transcript_6479:213-1541(+)|eukprot:CAMPEP_0196581830 /NCGR_PEP_ID=MMETSP1081-20130531/35856_1 /TAXON_ID=36882 /ORGANISM="Pyramimonas amylifera, Strain CCMP720" /LENGTH=442 /DNA_ID=CAMNT_0041902201 /DNA_START=201 /DNA_END=1529 /DNA_ORIENTATION=+
MPARKTTWTEHEDEHLRSLVGRLGHRNWTLIASKLSTKIGKQCRRRWQNHLNTTIKTHVWTAEEDKILIEGHHRLGNKWTEIARLVTGRTDNAVKNRFTALTKKTKTGSEMTVLHEDPGCISRLERSQSSESKLSSPAVQSCSSVGGACGEENTNLTLSLNAAPSTSADEQIYNPSIIHCPGNDFYSKLQGTRTSSMLTSQSSHPQPTSHPQPISHQQPIFHPQSTSHPQSSSHPQSTSYLHYSSHLHSIDDGAMEPGVSTAGNSGETSESVNTEGSFSNYPMSYETKHAETKYQKDIEEELHKYPVDSTRSEVGGLSHGSGSSPDIPVISEAQQSTENLIGGPVTVQELKQKFEDILIQSSCINGGLSFVAFALNTVSLALACCRGAGPTMETYFNSLCAIFQGANQGMHGKRPQPTGVPSKVSRPHGIFSKKIPIELSET